MSYKWRIWCNVHNWVYDWADTPITQCPIENSDPVDTNKTFRVGEEAAVTEMIPTVYRTKSNNYERMASIIYDTNTWGPLHRVSVLSYMDSNLDSYDIELYDKTNETSLITSNFSNTGDVSENDIGVISIPPEGRILLELNMKKNGSKKKYVYVNQIILYAKRETV